MDLFSKIRNIVIMKAFLIMASLSLIASPALAGDLFVRDGDSFVLNGQEIRLWGIDAPEYHQYCFQDEKSVPCGKYARQRLENLMEGEAVSCERVNTDRYKRMVARCSVHGEDIGRLMVSSGFAFDYTRYSHGAYSAEQKTAKNERRGLWSMDFEFPWIYKRRK